jgi:hypothetical protein
MTTIRIRNTKTAKKPGMITLTVVIRPSEGIPTFYIDVSITDRGQADLNLEEARGVLQQFSRDFQEALQQPLEFE